jgi:translation initiation factor IF-2
LQSGKLALAKKTAATRIHHLATELGVNSKDIIAKCEAEGIPNITNHMSTVSMGLAQTIREWFSAGAEVESTAVETAAPVDIVKVRARATKKSSKKARSKGSADDESGGTQAVAVAEEEEEVAERPTTTHAMPRARVQARAAGASPAEEDGAAGVADEEEAAPAQAAAEAPASAAASVEEAAPAATDEGRDTDEEGGAATADGQPVESARKPRMNVPLRPSEVKPVGPMLQQPSRTKLTGPKIIRVEQPEVMPERRPGPKRPAGVVGRGGPRVGRGAGFPPDESAEPGRPIRGAGVAGAAGARPADATRSRRNKRRSATAGDEAGRPSRAAYAGPGEQSANWREQDLRERQERLSRSGGFFKAHRRDTSRRPSGGGHRATTAAQTGGIVQIEAPISILNLSNATGIKSNDLLKRLMLAGHNVTRNSVLSAEQARDVMAAFNIDLEVVERQTAEQQIVEQFKQREMIDEKPRPPVVTILGHVDHGKTSLLDRIRNTNVAAGEAGGITQATSAFQVPVHSGDKDRVVTFLDTPGHEAFTEMRARGAKVTDLVVLVVAADDGVMPQTVESINHAKAAGVPIVVALNKIDRPEATDSNIQRVLGQLAEHELNPVEWGGTTEVVRTSAIRGDGVQDLLEVLDYQAELLELKGDAKGSAQGTVIEGRMEEGRGPVANALVRQGLLKKGDFVVVGRAYGRVRDIVNDHGKRIEEAGPSTPVVFSGIDEVPLPGDNFYVVKTLKEAEAAANERRELERERDLVHEKISLDNIFEKLAEAQRKELSIILKGDVQGVVETIKSTIEKLTTPEVAISVKHAAVGGVNDSDVLLAEATGAIIIGFNVTSGSAARRQAEAKGIEIRLYDVIYDIADDIKKAVLGMLEPEKRLEVLGQAEVREVFKVSKVGMVAGCYVTDGIVERNAQIRVTRGGIVVEKDRKLEQLKRFKDDAREVRAGLECGMKIEGYDDIKVGDVLECYKTSHVKRES